MPSNLWDSPPPSPLPFNVARPTRRSQRNICRTFALISTAAFSGMFLASALSLFGSPPPDGIFSAFPFHRSGAQEHYLEPIPPPLPLPPPPPPIVEEPLLPPPPPIPPPPPPRKHDDDHLELEELRDLVAQTKGYFVRDYSLGLGWNNVRYIIEAAVLHAQILNRTLVLPSFIYARSCEYDIAVCADYAPMVNKGDAIGWDEWRKLPIEEQMAWKIPINTMFNITHLRRTHPVITVNEYLRLHNFSADTEWSNGAWLRSTYHQHANVFESDPQKKPSLHVIENWWFDPEGVNRVDELPEDMKIRGNWSDEGGDLSKGQKGSFDSNVTTTTTSRLLSIAMPSGQSVLSWDEARRALQYDVPEDEGESHVEEPHSDENSEAPEVKDVKTRRWNVTSDEDLENVIRMHGWEVLYTFSGALGMDYVKHVAEPIRQVAPRESLRGVKEDYAHIDADVLLLSGEVHLNRKPGAVRFTTQENRDNFARLVLHQMHPTDKVLNLADRLDERMTERSGGRMWLAAHMRRGDFVRSNWVMEKTIQNHLNRVRDRLIRGRDLLGTLYVKDMKSYNVPDVTVDLEVLHRHVPSEQDKFYIATDEREPSNLTYLADNGAILIYDLLTIEDRHEFGWPLMVTDVLALVEQAFLARATYFYAHAMSSVAGGVINMRAARGADPRTALID